MKEKHYLFTDGSVNPQENIGFGAYVYVSQHALHVKPPKEDIKIKKFTNTSSTKLELETLLWALNEVKRTDIELVVFTDCQNILGLHSRRKKLEKNAYMTAKNKKISNHELYKEFYKITDTLNCQFVKVKGHKIKEDKNNIDKIFTLVDRASRNALREE